MKRIAVRTLCSPALNKPIAHRLVSKNCENIFYQRMIFFATGLLKSLLFQLYLTGSNPLQCTYVLWNKLPRVS